MGNHLGENIPKLGFGFMRLPKLEDGSYDMDQVKDMVDLFMESGFTYFDTAYVYDGGKSEEALRSALVERYPRDAYTVATKVNARVASTAEEAQRQLSVSLGRLGLEYVDFYLLHAVMDDVIDTYDGYGLWEFIRAEREAGRIRHMGFSFHGTPALLERLLTEHPEVEFVQLQLNYADWENPAVASRACYEIARSHGVPVVVMEPVKGGALATPPAPVAEVLGAADPDASAASWAIRYAASFEGIMTVLSGMSTLAQVEDNVSYMRDFKPLDEGERAVVERAREALAGIRQVPCTACRYCVEGCPQRIPIPDIFAARNQELIWGRADKAKAAYLEAVGAEGAGRASDCIRCGQCEAACPQNLPIIELLEECAEAYEG